MLFTFLPSRNLTGPSIIGIKSPMISKFWLHVWKVKNTFVNNGNMGWLSSTPQHIAGRAPPKESADAGAFQQGWKPIHIPPAGQRQCGDFWGRKGKNVNLGEREDRLFFSYRSAGRLKQANFLQGFVPNLHRAEGIQQGRGQFYFFISKISPCNTFRMRIISDTKWWWSG